MARTESAPEPVGFVGIREAWPTVAVGLALAVNAVWIGLLGYWLVKMIA